MEIFLSILVQMWIESFINFNLNFDEAGRFFETKQNRLLNTLNDPKLVQKKGQRISSACFYNSQKFLR